MIRLEEMHRVGPGVDVQVEGELDPSGAGVVGEALNLYAEQGVGQVRLIIDGLRRPDPETCEFLRQLAREHRDLLLASRSRFLRELLKRHGVAVEDLTPRASGGRG